VQYYQLTPSNRAVPYLPKSAAKIWTGISNKHLNPHLGLNVKYVFVKNTSSFNPKPVPDLAWFSNSKMLRDN